MKRTILPLLMVVSGALMLGCKDFDCCGPGVISTNPSALTIGGFIGASQDLSVNCPMAWTITDLPDWLIAMPDRGDFGGPVSLKATQGNPPGADPRSAVITFVAANGDKMRVTITQSAQEVYTVTYSLTGVTRSNPADAALQGEAYSTVFTAGTGYELPAAITVTMDGVLLTEGVEYNYNSATGEFEISNVTGNLVITIVGVETITVNVIIMTATLYGSLDTPATVTSTSDISQAELDALITLHANRVITGWYTTNDPDGTKAEFPITATTTLYVRLNGDGVFNAAPVEIVNAAELAALGTRVNADPPTEPAGLYYKLIADINLSGYQSGEGWTPIGNPRQFSGHFDGAGFKVSGLYINRTAGLGLFGVINGGSVQNLGVEIAAGGITGTQNIGGVAALVTGGGSISNCYVTGNVSGTRDVGGVAGRLVSSSISNSYTTGNVSGSNGGIGGVAGTVTDGGSISNSYATGNISSSGGSTGGVAGTVDAGSSISNSYAAGNVSGNYTAGGVAAFVDNSSISNSYATGNVSGIRDVGGVAGFVTGGGSISNCYATGNISGNDRVGGVAGYIVASSSISNCAAFNPSITRTSGTGTYFGRVVGFVVGTLTGNVARADMTAIGGFAFAGLYTADGFNGLDVNATTLQTTYTGLGWLFNDSTPAGPWIWDTAGFPKLGFGTETNPF